jgi:NTP pyrophosphatase (non-canonical NTP hydrolase)
LARKIPEAQVSATQIGCYEPMKIENFDRYQQESRKTWNVIPMNHSIVYPTMGMVNEAGEVAGKVKKIFRDRGGEITDADRQALKKELGDVLWYLAQICTELDLSLQEVAEANLIKLFSRLERGQIKGDGDER